MAVTENKLIKRADRCKVGYPVEESTTLYQGTLAFINASGYLDDDTGSGVNRFAGIVIGKGDNASGADAAIKTEVWTEGVFTLVTGSDFTQASVGMDVYATDNYTIVLTPTAAAVRIGHVDEYVSSTSVRVAIETDQPLSIRTPGVVAKTADYTLTVQDSGKTFTTVGASGTVVFSLPAAIVGCRYRFRVGAAQELRIDPNGTEVIALPSTGVASAAGAYLTANADGETVEIECTKAGTWSVFGFTGTWTAV